MTLIPLYLILSPYVACMNCSYNEKMTTESIAQSVSNLALSFGDDDADPGAMSRPFGVALLLAGCDDDMVSQRLILRF